MGIFKAYDIRGIYPDELNEAMAQKIGWAFTKFFGAKTIAVGYDMRQAAPSIFDALAKGINSAGVDVVSIGQVSTPMISFVVGHFGYDAGIMITASHNPKEYIGFKVCDKNVVPIGYDHGLNTIEQMVEEFAGPEKVSQGEVIAKDIWDEYVCHVHDQVDTSCLKPLKVVVDAGNGMGGVVFEKVFAGLPLTVDKLYFEPDGTFPNHEPNPLKSENMKDLQKRVIETKSDIGFAFDGDADRVMFVDESGQLISSDMVTILIGKYLLEQYPGSKILYDLRSSRAVKEEIEKLGGQTSMCRVGHAFIKRQLRKENGLFAGELSGHYYFKSNFYADSGMMAALYVLAVLSKEDQPISELIQPYKRYYASGEINSEVRNADQKIREIESLFSDGDQDHLDGLTVNYSRWWFNVRKSNTEPVLRLNLEADDINLGEEKLKKLMKVIRG